MKWTFIKKVQKILMEVAVRSVGKSVPPSMYERKVPEELKKQGCNATQSFLLERGFNL